MFLSIRASEKEQTHETSEYLTIVHIPSFTYLILEKNVTFYNDFYMTLKYLFKCHSFLNLISKINY